MKRIRYWLPDFLVVLSVLACVFEGSLRKWVFRDSPGPARYACYFAKDIVWIALVVFCRPRGEALTKNLGRVLIIGLPLVALGAAISSARDLNLVGGLLSFRSLIGLP